MIVIKINNHFELSQVIYCLQSPLCPKIAKHFLMLIELDMNLIVPMKICF